MFLKQLKLSAVRNLNPLTLTFSPNLNVFVGKNGSGKTSFLESIYLLATGRSFRTRDPHTYIQWGESFCSATGLLSTNKEPSVRLGMLRKQNGQITLKMNEEIVTLLGDWLKLLPVYILNIDSYQLLSASSKMRRQFLDWALFHVEQTYYPQLRRYQRVLKQRNMALKQAQKSQAIASIRAWDPELIEAGEWITEARQRFLQDFYPILLAYQADFLKIDPLKGLRLETNLGWQAGISLKEALDQAFGRDRVLGYTTVGPHRADFRFFSETLALESILSRGQLKLFVSGLFLARNALVTQMKGATPICMLDDLASELDETAVSHLLQGLKRQNAQIFMTSITPQALKEVFTKKEIKWFHVEQGHIQETDHLDSVYLQVCE